MTNGGAVAKRLRPSEVGGIPWMVIVSETGDSLVTSDGPKGNVGYPFEPHEIEHFMTMLKKTTRKMSPEQAAAVEKDLRDYAAKRKAAQPKPKAKS